VPARLHHELIGDAERRLLITHGIYGAGGNWRSIARKLQQQRPEWSIVLVDLRQHGRSEAGEPPHTVAACADDLRALFDELPGIEAIAGHSFGGKVVLQTRALAPPTLRQTWMLDASPSARPGAEDDHDNSVTRVLELMERLPKTWAKRDDFITAVTNSGQALPLAQWLAMNVVADDTGQFTLRLDLAAVRAMLADYYARDLWDVAFDPALPGELHVVIAEQSKTLSADDRTRLASAPPHVHTHRIDAGHWLHIEAAANVVELLASGLPTALS
jgi:esterase